MEAVDPRGHHLSPDDRLDTENMRHQPTKIPLDTDKTECFKKAKTKTSSQVARLSSLKHFSATLNIYD